MLITLFGEEPFFENGAAAFQSKERPARQVEEKQKRIEFLEKKVQTKDEVLAERVIAEFPWCFVIVGQAVLGVAACVLLPCPLQVLLKTALIVAPSC